MMKRFLDLFKGRLNATGRLNFTISGFLLALSFFYPIWGMMFVSHEYPEGIRFIAYSSFFAGDLDIINTLNHYIGVRKLIPENFPELKVVPFLLGVTVLSSLAAAWAGWRWLAAGTAVGLILMAVGGGALMVYRVYEIGFHRDPKAILDIKNFLLPVLGKMQFLNYTVSGWFMAGTLLIFLALALMLLTLWRGDQWQDPLLS